jgi:hypothetical protein
MGQATGKMQALSQLMGSWEITVKTFGGDSSSAQASPTSTAQGTSNRSWLFDQKILQEDVRCTPTRAASSGITDEDDGALGYTDPEDKSDDTSAPPRTTPPSRPNTPPSAGGSTPPSTTTPPRPGGSSMSTNQAFQGHGMFAFDQKTGQFEHVWCDNTASKLTLSTGKYDESSKTFTFNVKDSGMGGSARPSTPPTGGGMGGGADDDDTPPTGQPPRGATGSTSGGSMAGVDMSGLEKVVLRITSDNQHVIEYYKSGNSKIMEVTYSKAR